ncbi:MAG TPA: serine/threonine-protein kinase [Gemmataceae bacterium]|nr:serine/threonine-protein kinase [Gemmataceae bacterium]
MPVVSACPDVSLLQQFALGRMSPQEVERLARHCEQCPRCLQVLHSLKAVDTLPRSLAAQGAAAGQRARDAAVNALLERLKRLPAVASSMERTAAFAVAATSSGEVVAAAVVEKTLAGDISLAPPQSPDEIGRLGGYRILKILGAGGMGMVYHAEDVQLQRLVALKVMKPEVARNPLARERFLREARAAARVKSDHVVTIHHVGEDREIVFLAMEFLEGMSMDDWLKKGRTPTVAQAARMGRQIALGLAAAHERGLMHRDIKPGNIWLESSHQGRIKLLDFGLARGETEEVQLTQSGAIVGTPAYMAPEQARGGNVDYRADLFSLGVVLYRLTTGRLPFRGDNTMSLLTALALDTPTPPREVNAAIPLRLAALIERLLTKDREQRPKTAKAVADELAAIERETTEERTVQVRAANIGERGCVSAPSETRSRGADTAPLAAPLRSRLRWLVAASLLVLLGGATAAIVVIIRDKNGKKVAEIPVPPGGSAEVKENGRNKAKPPAPKVEVRIEPEPLAPMKDGEPLSSFAFVTHPAKLPGVRSWSIARRETGTPSAVAYRPDGQRLAIASWDGSVHIWEEKTGRLKRVILTHGTAVALAWSPDGGVLAVGTGAFKRPVHLWDAETGRFLRKLETPEQEFIFALAWSPDGRTIRGWGTQRRCYTWEAANGKRLYAPPIDCPFERPVFSAVGQRMAAPMDGKRIVIWNTDTGKEVSRLTAPAAVWNVAWSPSGKRLASTGPDGLRIWDVETRKAVFHYAKAGHQNDPPAWSPDGRRVVYSLGAPAAGTEVIDVTGTDEPLQLQDGGESWLAWSPDGSTIARINGEPWVFVHGSATGEKLRTLTWGRAIYGFAWSPDDRTLALSERFGTFLASADTGQVVAELKQETWPKTQTAWPMAWSPDGKHLAAQGPDNAIQFWQADGRVHHALADYKAEITSLAWSPDGKRLATTAAGEKRVLIWDAAKGERDRELGPFAAETQGVKWSADGRLLTFNVPDVGWHVWDAQQNKLVNDPKQWKLFWFDLTPDGRSAIVAPKEKDVYRLRELASGKDGVQLPYAHNIFLAHPTWSADGTMLAVSLYDGIQLWRPDLSKRLRTMPLDGGASQIAFSRDGKWMAALTGERLFVWETETGRLCGLRILGRRNNALTMTPNGHYTGNDKVDSGIVMVVERDDGTRETLEPAEFKRKYDFQNDPNKVHLLRPNK